MTPIGKHTNRYYSSKKLSYSELDLINFRKSHHRRLFIPYKSNRRNLRTAVSRIQYITLPYIIYPIKHFHKMGTKIITFGEIMLRLSTPGHLRFCQSDTYAATFGGGEANVAVSLANFGLETEFIKRHRIYKHRADTPYSIST